MKNRFIFIGSFGLVAFITIFCFLIFNSQGKKATSEPILIISENQKTPVGGNVQSLSPVVVKNVLIIDGKKNPLLCTFQDREKAMENVKIRDADFLQLMQKKWMLKDLDNFSWKIYKQKLVQYTAGKLPDDLGGDKLDSQRQEFESFLGIYEDEELNEKTLAYVNRANFLLQTKLISQVSLDPIIGNLPFDAPILQKA